MDLELSSAQAIAMVVAAASMLIVGRALPVRFAAPVAGVVALTLGAVVGSGLAAVVGAVVLALSLLVGVLIRTGAEHEQRAELVASGGRSGSWTHAHSAGGEGRAAELWANPHRLTRREVEVLQLIAGGRSNQEISHSLHISMATVKTHVNHIFSKTGVRDRAQAVAYAYEHGLAAQQPPAE